MWSCRCQCVSLVVDDDQHHHYHDDDDDDDDDDENDDDYISLSYSRSLWWRGIWWLAAALSKETFARALGKKMEKGFKHIQTTKQRTLWNLPRRAGGLWSAAAHSTPNDYCQRWQMRTRLLQSKSQAEISTYLMCDTVNCDTSTFMYMHLYHQRHHQFTCYLEEIWRDHKSSYFSVSKGPVVELDLRSKVILTCWTVLNPTSTTNFLRVYEPATDLSLWLLRACTPELACVEFPRRCWKERIPLTSFDVPIMSHNLEAETKQGWGTRHIVNKQAQRKLGSLHCHLQWSAWVWSD